MSTGSKIVQCVPNFSEGRDLDKINQIVKPFQTTADVKLLNYSNDEDHNRLVVSVAGEPQAVQNAVIAAMAVAKEIIDLTQHEGQHPRMGATDVVPFIPVKNMTVDECDALAKATAKRIYEELEIPVFLYEKSASKPNRQNLADVRKGQFEGMAEKIKQPEWAPDFGTAIHPTAGITAVGTRMALVAFNVNLNTNDLAVADKIAKNVRHLSGGLRFCKAIGVELKERGIVQISMNMTDYTKTPLYRAFELIRIEAERYGVSIVGSEVIGNVPLDALIQTAEWYLRIENFDPNQVLEKQIWE